MHPERQYLDLLEDILDNGSHRDGRNGETLGVFGRQIRFDLSKGFPLLTTKDVFWRGVVAELLWFLAGDTNNKTLTDQGVTIWNEWAAEDGALGPIYGHQWRSWSRFRLNPEGVVEYAPIDQISAVIEGLKTDPNGRRHIVSAWNVGDIDSMALPPCHCLFQFFVANGKLSCQLYQRSADMFLGVPFNIASYALLTLLIAKECGLEPGEFIHTFGDAHLYDDHFEQARTQIARTPTAFPTVTIADKSIFELTAEDIVLTGYKPQGKLKAAVRK